MCAEGALSAVCRVQNIHSVRCALEQYEEEDVAGESSGPELIWGWVSHVQDLLSAGSQVRAITPIATPPRCCRDPTLSPQMPPPQPPISPRWRP